jgi:dienelactone hydrolase
MHHALLILCGTLLLTVTAQAAIKTEVVDYKVGDVDCRGYLAYDDQAGKRPGVLVAPEWWGLTDYARHRAEMLAGLGYVAFAMDPFGDGKTTDDPQEAGKLAGALKSDIPELRRRATAALDVLAKQPMVDPDKLAAIGYCFGGTTVLELARSGAPILGVVSFHGGLATPNPKDAANIKGKVLICHGGDDKFESPEEIAEFQQSMRDANVDWQMIIYGGAVHAFTNPDADRHHISGIAYNANADHRSWQAMQNFFHEIFDEPADSGKK